jgi:endonuclease/exonuclease/phosphatase family metal-dependent hydrolase
VADERDDPTFRVATWNLERRSSRAWSRAPFQQERMTLVDADIWVLTETFVDRVPGAGFDAVFSPPNPDRRPNPDERWTAIWSRWPITPLDDPAPHRRGSVAGMVTTPMGSLIVYGTVIAYHLEPAHDDGRPARAWEVHAAEIERQAQEWHRIRERHPDVPIVVAGDFNQARSGRPWSYGTDAARQAVTDGLARAGVRCLTEVDLVETGAISDRSHVEHICATEELEQVGPLRAWDRVDDNGRELSDHPTLAVDLLLR